MSSISSIRDTFFEECEDLLEALNEGLDEISGGGAEDETINAVFRAVHSIKGGAGAFGLDALVGFAHKYETVLDAVRSQTVMMDDDLMYVLRRAGDQLSVLVEASRDELEINEDASAALVEELNEFLVDDDGKEEVEFSFQAVALDLAPIAEPEVENPAQYKVTFHPKPELFTNGHEPRLLFKALAELGELEVSLDHHQLPAFDELVDGEFYLSWDLSLATSESETEIHHVFEFVEGLCDLEIAPVEPDPVPAIDLPLESEPVSAPAETIAPETTTAEPMPSSEPETSEPDAKRSDAAKTRSGPKPTVRVDLERVDRLINTVGELIINRAMIAQRVIELNVKPGSDIINDLEEYGFLAREIQEGVMSIRAQPIKPLFQRMARIVREASDATGKKVVLEMEGEGVEVDKTVIERLADPLTHMIRNAVDHGIEDTGKRQESGKDEIGKIHLSAKHRSGSILIEIADDGAGLNREKIFDIAVSKGLIQAGTELSNSEIDNLLFLPGFSTATEVSNLSGRGVGMDVVKNAVTTLGGKVSIASTPGKGTVFTVVLPLTMAVMDGMVITVADQTMVVPITSILETIRPSEDDLHSLGTNENVLSIRGDYVPIIDVAKCLELSQQDGDMASRVLLLLDIDGGGQCAFAVDAIHDQRQVVIKPCWQLRSDPGRVRSDNSR